jgi:hypothetical protein
MNRGRRVDRLDMAGLWRKLGVARALAEVPGRRRSPRMWSGRCSPWSPAGPASKLATVEWASRDVVVP